ncbi:uncharacterized protein LOC132294404 isoform X2 [Cornus florida]|nr:uncharacterized protein LOC132294404 isoform X2 [Cornus florida]
MMSNGDSQSISLKVLVDKDKNRVVCVESNEDFVDVLFSFMTMPLGNFIRVAREHSIEDHFGCLNNLYESVENLDEKHLQSVKCKDMLLRPRSAAEIYCMNLKLNFVNSDTNEYYMCYYDHCFGPYYNARCHCGRVMGCARNLEVQGHVPPDGGVFVNPTARLMITDDFHVKPISTTSILALLSKFEATDSSTREERTINIGRDKVMKLLSCSLTTRAPFSEIILEPAIDKSSFDICHEKYGPRSMNQLQRAVDATKNETKTTLNLIIRKSSNRALYAEANEDFVNLIGSFLTYPLGYIFEKLPCLSLRGCLDNMYKSIQDLDAKKFLKSEEIKAILVNPKLARGLALHNQLISIEEASYPSHSTASSLFNISSGGGLTRPVEAITGNGFFRGPFLVTDDLTIMPLSLMSIVCFMDRFNISHSDILEQEVTIGVEEALCLLGAALVSKTALTDVFILKESKQEL